ncbi:MAG: PH domain-containing protein [bacterium]
MASLRESIPLQKRKIIKKSIENSIGLLFIYGFFLFMLIVFKVNNPTSEIPKLFLRIACLLFIIISCFIIPFYEYWYYKRYFYDIDTKNIIIRKGVIAQKEITLPFSRITDVYVYQDILDVIFGLYDIHMSTPTEQSGQFAHIDGVDKSGNEKLKQIILTNINKEFKN